MRYYRCQQDSVCSGREGREGVVGGLLCSECRGAQTPLIAGDDSYWSVFITSAFWLNQNRHIPITPCKTASRFPSTQANKEAYLSCHNYTLHFGMLREALLFSGVHGSYFASLDFLFFIFLLPLPRLQSSRAKYIHLLKVCESSVYSQAHKNEWTSLTRPL